MSRERGDILELLPEVMRAADAPGTPFAALIDAMHAISAPIDRIIDDLDRWFDPATAPVDFLRLLAAWLDLDVAADVLTALEPDAERRERRLRRLVAEGHDLVRRRGTAESLRRLVELASGLDGVRIATEPARGRRFHVVVVLPAAAGPMRPLLARLVDHERPVHVTWSLEAAPAEAG